jgi:hypothetical protein
MKTSASGGIAPPFVISALDIDEWSGSRPGRFTPGEIAVGANWIGGVKTKHCVVYRSMRLMKDKEYQFVGKGRDDLRHVVRTWR